MMRASARARSATPSKCNAQGKRRSGHLLENEALLFVYVGRQRYTNALGLDPG
jgi:hypothetical protein